MTRVAGDTALITCVVTQREDRSVLWRREEAGQGAGLLAVNTDVVTSDPRVSVLHEAGGEVWVLQLRGLAPADSGTYSCELNTAPPTVSRHRVLVLPRLPRSRVGDTEDTEVNSCEQTFPFHSTRRRPLQERMRGPSPGPVQLREGSLTALV